MKVQFVVEASWLCKQCGLKQSDPELIVEIGGKVTPFCKKCTSKDMIFMGDEKTKKLWELYAYRNLSSSDRFDF